MPPPSNEQNGLNSRKRKRDKKWVVGYLAHYQKVLPRTKHLLFLSCMARQLESGAGTFRRSRPFPVAKTALCRGMGDLRFQMAHFFEKQSHQVIENTRQVSGIGQNNPKIGHCLRNKISGCDGLVRTVGAISDFLEEQSHQIHSKHQNDCFLAAMAKP